MAGPASTTPTGPVLSALGQRTLRKIRWRLMPIIGVLYFVAFLDRNNVGFAKITMSHDIDLSAAAYGFGAGVFFIGYALFEVPSNGAMYRYGARRWITRIMVSWGVVATAMALVHGDVSFSIIRFLLGVAEAGFFPAIVFYLTLWFPARERVTVLSLFVLAQPISSAVGAPISGLILAMDGVLGLHGWQWLFIIQGTPAIILGLLVPVFLTDRPSLAPWLDADEKAWLVEAMETDVSARPSHGRERFRDGLKDPRALVYAVLNFGMVCGIYGFGLWLPTIVNALGHFSTTKLGFIVMIPYAFAAVFLYFWGRGADRTGKRAVFAAVSMVIAAVGLVGAGFTLSISPLIALLFLIVAAMGVYSATAPLLAMPSAAFVGAAAAAGLALVNAIGNVGGFVAPYAVGLINEATGTNRAGLVFLACCLLVTALATYLYARRRPEGSGVPNRSGAVDESSNAIAREGN
jgi:MFS transporter, ACS family, tartrate transporter